MSELESRVPSLEKIKANPENFGLHLENSNGRRSIFSILDVEKFISLASDFGIGVISRNKIKEYNEKYPDALKQFFIINKPKDGETIRLGDHYHTSVKNGGSGSEVFIFVNVPVDTDIKLQQYNLGRATGKMRYGVKSDAVMENNPNDYHVFDSNGPFQMVQFLEGGFQPEDLRKFNETDWGKSDKNLINGRGI